MIKTEVEKTPSTVKELTDRLLLNLELIDRKLNNRQEKPGVPEVTPDHPVDKILARLTTAIELTKYISNELDRIFGEED